MQKAKAKLETEAAIEMVAEVELEAEGKVEVEIWKGPSILVQKPPRSISSGK